MDARPLSAAMLATLLLYCCGGAVSGQQPSVSSSPCNPREDSLLFSSCLWSFGMAHMNNMGAMRSAPSCLYDKLNCTAAGEAVNCISKLTLSEKCEKGIKVHLTYTMKKYRLKCSYNDVECKCWRNTPDIVQSVILKKNIRRTTVPQGCPPFLMGK